MALPLLLLVPSLLHSSPTNAGFPREPAATGSQDTAPAAPAAEEPPDFLSRPEWDPTTPRGVLTNDPRATPGLTFVSPINSTRGHLIDNAGAIVHTWQFDSAPGEWGYLLGDGTLLRAGRQDQDQRFGGGGIGGKLQRVAHDGTLLWDLDLASEGLCQHHDIAVLPNGNVLVVAWERIPKETAIANGRDPAWVGEAGLWPDTVLELEPVGSDGARIVWQWRAWDHLVQDFDASKANHGDVTAAPGRIDVNGDHRDAPPLTAEQKRAFETQQAQLEALGYTTGVANASVGDDPEALARRRARLDRSGDWLHTNAIDHCPEHDLIVLSVPEFDEVWVIDHSTTIEEARGSTGGRFGRGGELLYRWGNPKTYGHGSEADRVLDYQHDPQWLVAPDGNLHLTLFDNGGRGSERNASEVLEIVLPFDPAHGFLREEGEPFGPAEPLWSYSSPTDFYSAFISGAQRLRSGHTLICSGAGGRVFEVTPGGETVWNYRCDLGGDVEPPRHAGHAPEHALFRAERYDLEHPGIVALLAAKAAARQE
jgi:hypothetical protein